jgi:hypothetical protein
MSPRLLLYSSLDSPSLLPPFLLYSTHEKVQCQCPGSKVSRTAEKIGYDRRELEVSLHHGSRSVYRRFLVRLLLSFSLDSPISCLHASMIGSNGGTMIQLLTTFVARYPPPRMYEEASLWNIPLVFIGLGSEAQTEHEDTIKDFKDLLPVCPPFPLSTCHCHVCVSMLLALKQVYPGGLSSRPRHLCVWLTDSSFTREQTEDKASPTAIHSGGSYHERVAAQLGSDRCASRSVGLQSSFFPLS